MASPASDRGGIDLITRRTAIFAGAGFAVSSGRQSEAGLPSLTLAVPDATMDALIDAGGWAPTAEDNGSNERLPETFLRQLLAHTNSTGDDAGRLTSLGILALALSIAEWGVAWSGSPPSDPAGTKWKGPASIDAGKHMMSYSLGGLGLAHLDKNDIVAFLKELAKTSPGTGKEVEELVQYHGGFTFDRVRSAGGMCAADPEKTVIMTDLDSVPFKHDFPYLGGLGYCPIYNGDKRLDPAAWQRLRHWERVGLRRRDMQTWVVNYWLNAYWLPAYQSVMARPHGTVSEALIIVRIANSGPALAAHAVKLAGNEPDTQRRIDTELGYYGNLKKTYHDRLGVMRRPVVVLKALST